MSADVEKLMKRCQIGVGGRNALDDAHSIMAECYGTLGRLSSDLTAAREDRDHWKAARDMALSGGEILKRERDAAREQIAALTADRDSWAEQDSQHVGELVEAMKRVAELEAGLRPFLCLYPSGVDHLPDDRTWYRIDDRMVTLGDLRVARALLAPSPEPKP